MSRSQTKEYLSYLIENGISDIVEAPDHISYEEPVATRIGATVNSVKEFHVDRFAENRVEYTTLGYNFLKDESKPKIPEGTTRVGIFYFSKKTEYSSTPDVLRSDEHVGDIGDVIWFDANLWEDFTLGKCTDGNNYRLFAFWGAR